MLLRLFYFNSSYKNTDTKELEKHNIRHIEAYNWTKLSDKSREQYERIYSRFVDWRTENKIETFTEADMMAYFTKLIADKLKYSTVLSVYSILRTTLVVKHNVDIGKYEEIYRSLKHQSKGYKPAKSEVFTPEQILDFLNTAPDDRYLLTKVVLIIGVIGALGRDDLKKLTVNDVKDTNNALVITIRNINFTITGHFYNICKKYISLRPRILEQAFFLNYRNGKCSKQVVGINNFSRLPPQIATFLKLPNPKSYTGKCFRRTAATVGLDSKGNFIKMQRKWKKVLQSYQSDDAESEEEVTPFEFCSTSIKQEPE